MVRTPRPSQPARLACILLGSLFLAASVHPRVEARTWRVEKDGSGDSTQIQAAIDAAAPGDTIQVGIGRFDTFHEYTFVNGGPVQCIASIASGPLVIRGVSHESILGPQTQRNYINGLRRPSLLWTTLVRR